MTFETAPSRFLQKALTKNLLASYLYFQGTYPVVPPLPILEFTPELLQSEYYTGFGVATNP